MPADSILLFAAIAAAVSALAVLFVDAARARVREERRSRSIAGWTLLVGACLLFVLYFSRRARKGSATAGLDTPATPTFLRTPVLPSVPDGVYRL